VGGDRVDPYGMGKDTFGYLPSCGVLEDLDLPLVPEVEAEDVQGDPVHGFAP